MGDGQNHTTKKGLGEKKTKREERTANRRKKIPTNETGVCVCVDEWNDMNTTVGKKMNLLEEKREGGAQKVDSVWEVYFDMKWNDHNKNGN